MLYLSLATVPISNIPGDMVLPPNDLEAEQGVLTKLLPSSVLPSLVFDKASAAVDTSFSNFDKGTF